MAVFATIVISLVVLLSFIAVVISMSNRAIVAEMEEELKEALAAIELARRFCTRQSHQHLSGSDYVKRMGITE